MWGIPWVNLTMLLATIPVYESDKDEDDPKKKEEDAGDGIDVDSPEDLKAFLKM